MALRRHQPLDCAQADRTGGTALPAAAGRGLPGLRPEVREGGLGPMLADQGRAIFRFGLGPDEPPDDLAIGIDAVEFDHRAQRVGKLVHAALDVSKLDASLICVHWHSPRVTNIVAGYRRDLNSLPDE